MNRHNALTQAFAALMIGLGFGVAGAAVAAEVSADRLNNPEPQNWLMNHRTYDA